MNLNLTSGLYLQHVSSILRYGARNDLRFANIRQSCQTLANDEHIHKVGAHVGSVKVKSEKSVVVAQC